MLNLLLRRVYQPLGAHFKVTSCSSKTAVNYSTAKSIDTAHSSNLRIGHVKDDADCRMLHIHWTDGSSGRFPYVWLRENCPAPHTYILSNSFRTRKLLLKDLDIWVKPDRLEIVSSGDGISIEWPNEEPATYSASWLKSRNLDDLIARHRRQKFDLESPVLWDCESIKNRMTEVKFNDLMNDDNTMLLTLTALMRDGIVSVLNAPGDYATADLGENIGFTYPTHYHLIQNRAVDQIKSRPGHGSLAYTSNALGLHTDLPQLMYPPQTIMLHSITPAPKNGGANQFVDGFKVAETLRTENPKLSQILTETEFEFLDHGDSYIGYCLRGTWKTIRLNDDGSIKAIHFNNQIRSWFINEPVTKTQQIYEALKAFNDLCYDPKFCLNVTLKPGQIMWVSNDRVMHGRTSFEVTNSDLTQMEVCTGILKLFLVMSV